MPILRLLAVFSFSFCRSFNISFFSTSWSFNIWFLSFNSSVSTFNNSFSILMLSNSAFQILIRYESYHPGPCNFQAETVFFLLVLFSVAVFVIFDPAVPLLFFLVLALSSLILLFSLLLSFFVSVYVLSGPVVLLLICLYLVFQFLLSS